MSCTDTCVSGGISTLYKIIEIVITGAQPTAAPTIIQLITNALVTLQCKLPPNVIEIVENQLVLLQDISTNTLKQETIAYVTVIFSTFLLLTILCYIAMYMGGSAILVCGIISVVVIIIALFGLLYWLDTILVTSGNQISVILSTLKDLLQNTVAAGREAFCCLGPCSICATCPI